MQPNTELASRVLTVLRPHLGRYSLSGADRGLSWHQTPKSFALVNEGLEAGYKATKLEAIFALYPDPNYRAEHEFGDEGMKGVLYHACTLKAWSLDMSVMPAFEALVLAFPLMTLTSHRAPRQVPSDLAEVLVVWIPEQR